MNKLKFVLFISLFSVFLSSCSKDEDKDEFKTEGELIGEQLQQFVTDKNISLATTYLVDFVSGGGAYYSSDEYKKGFSINGQIIKVGDTYYNLNKLVKYEANEILLLYFDGYQM